MMKRLVLAASLALSLAACQDDGFNRSSRHLAPIPPATLALMGQKGMSKSDPIVIRSYKKESEMEIWKRGSDGRYALLKTYPICRWSGQLGPKVREGDRQAPEGFYTITPAQMNPNSAYYLSFDTGFPNAYDRAYGRTGAALMVHGACSSRGCFAMTDETIAEVYSVAREAFIGGQRNFQFQSYPFRMTAKNLAQHRYDPNMPFWKNIKEGSDYFEALREEPKVAVCGKRYVFGGTEVAQGDCNPALSEQVAEKQRKDDEDVARLVADGMQPVQLVYNDGGQHESFRSALSGGITESGSLVIASRSRNLGDVSRPEALAAGPREIILDNSGKPREAPATALALAPSSSPSSISIPAPETKVASAGNPLVSAQPIAQQPAQPSVTGESKPFYQRMFSGLNGLLGTEEQAASPAVNTPPPPVRSSVKVQDRSAQVAPASTASTSSSEPVPN